MTRTGKIARLPRDIREQLNRRLQDGEPGTKLVNWLNALADVQAVLGAEFDGRPISEQNLSEWKAVGYRDWLTQQEALDMIQQLSADTAELKEAANELITDKLAVWLAARYVAVAKSITVTEDGDANEWRRLREFCNDLVALRKGDHSQERLKLEQERLQQLERELKLKREKKIETAIDELIEESRHNPKLRAAVDQLCEAVKEAA